MSSLVTEGVSVGRTIGRGWAWFTTFVMAAVLFQAATAGGGLDGAHWAQTTHRALAGLLVVSGLVAGIAAVAGLRARPGGRQLATMLAGLAGVLLVQYGLGTAAGDGRSTLWLHVPVGVMIVGLTMQANRLARRLADPTPARPEGSTHG